MKFAKISSLLPWLIVGLAFFLRIFRAEERFPFTMDEEYQAFLVREILGGRHFPLIGVNVADTGLYLGPFFTYLSTLPYWLFGGSPLGGAAVAALAGAITTLLLIKVGQLVSRPTGLLAGLWYAVGFLPNAWDRKYWNPTFVPLLSLLLLLALIKTRQQPRWWLVVFGVFGLAFHTHYSLFLLLPPLIHVIKKFGSKINGKVLLRGGVVLALCVLPLGLFEVRHEFAQTKALIEFTGFKNTPGPDLLERNGSFLQTLNRFIYVPGNHDLAEEISLCKNIIPSEPLYPVGIFVVVAILVLPLLAQNRQEKLMAYFIVSSFLVGYAAWLLFPKPVSEYYLLPLVPLGFLSLAWVGEWLMSHGSRWVAWGLGATVLGALIYNTYSTVNLEHSFGLKKKREMIEWVGSQVGNQTYSLDSQTGCYRFEGYRYLFAHYFKPPAASFMDPYFTWLYAPNEQPQSEADANVKIVSQLLKDDQEWEEKRVIPGLVVKDFYPLGVEIRN